ncbi:MAG: septum formation initiator family protein [Eubacterium sp.]|nr:septum formation initiator family protein [Eubacterium sp.]
MKKPNSKRRRHTGLYLVVLLVGIFVASLAIQGYALSSNCDRLQAEQAELEAKKRDLEEQKAEIQEKAEYMKTDQYIEDVAREKLGLAYKDEIIFKAADSE